MATTEIILPTMGEGIIEATITKWLVSEGDQVDEDDVIAEIATDKVDSEIPAPGKGTIDKLKYQEGETVKVGDTIALIQTSEEKAVSAASETNEIIKQVQTKKAQISEKQQTQENEVAEKPYSSKTPSGKFLSPLVRNMAKAEKISIAELEKIQGTGLNKRITKNDILSYLSGSSEKDIPEISKKPSMEKVSAGNDTEIIEMDRMRRLIADHMVRSKQVSPHVTSFVEVDMTPVVQWRNQVKNAFQQREGQKITFTPIIAEAVAKAIRDFPMINVSVDNNQIILKKNINLGIAVALPSGNLIVPVIKNAGRKNLLGLAKEVNDLASRARENKLKPDEINNGTFTITNFGTFGNISGTPIINQPEAAILGVGEIKKKPVVLESHAGDSIGIRSIMILSLAYDHRVVDGALGGQFLKRIGDYLEKFDTTRNI